MSRAHRNVAVVAFANKLARIAWAALRLESVLPPEECPGGVGLVDQGSRALFDR